MSKLIADITPKLITAKLVAVLASLSLLSGCMFITPQPNTEAWAPPPPEKMAVPENRTGAIYNAGYDLRLFETLRARNIGDILTVVLVERTDASKKATTNQSKDDSVAIAEPTILGQKLTSFSFELSGKRAFDGQGESKQNNQLEGSITVTVHDIMPNGNLIVRGEKWLTLNRGNEFIRLSGIVRPADITPENTVRSDRIADARISYSGTGQVADSNVKGWLSRFFSTVFFPY